MGYDSTIAVATLAQNQRSAPRPAVQGHHVSQPARHTAEARKGTPSGTMRRPSKYAWWSVTYCNRRVSIMTCDVITTVARFVGRVNSNCRAEFRNCERQGPSCPCARRVMETSYVAYLAA